VFGKRFVLRADKKLTAFVELESANSRLRRVCLTSRRDFRAFTMRAPMSGASTIFLENFRDTTVATVVPHDIV
jgi:hypothetical protein